MMTIPTICRRMDRSGWLLALVGIALCATAVGSFIAWLATWNPIFLVIAFIAYALVARS